MTTNMKRITTRNHDNTMTDNNTTHKTKTTQKHDTTNDANGDGNGDKWDATHNTKKKEESQETSRDRVYRDETAALLY